jgi:excisionase family DNA binding protein
MAVVKTCAQYNLQASPSVHLYPFAWHMMRLHPRQWHGIIFNRVDGRYCLEPHMTRETMFTVQEVADQLNVHPDTVRQWIRSGKLEAIDLGGRAGFRVSESALQKFIRERKVRPQGT